MKNSILMRGASVLTLAAGLLATAPAIAAPGEDWVPVTDEMILDPDPANWLSFRRTLDSWGYSPLDQITADNVSQLQLVWTRGLASGIGEGTPLVYDGWMFFPQTNDIIEAYDAATGALAWRYERELPADLNEYMPFTQINRNVAIYDDIIIDTTGDNYLLALDAQTGQIAWETQINDYQVTPAQHTTGPIIVNGKIISTSGCEPFSGPEACAVVAHDAESGELLWRTLNIPRSGEDGDETWGDVPYEGRWHVGAWMAPSYDPELNLIIYGTSVTAPAPKFMLGGTENQHLYHNSTIALDADTGERVWYYQHLIDNWDLDHPFERLLVDTVVAPDADEVAWINPNIEEGREYRVVTGVPGKTGIVYTLDRETGEFLWATPTVYQNVVESIDGETGAVTTNAAVVPDGPEQTVAVCPSQNGGKNFFTGAYSPLNNVMYYSLFNTCMDVTTLGTVPGVGGGGVYQIAMTDQRVSPDAEFVGTMRGIDVSTGKTLWLNQTPAATLSVLTTGSELLFAGDVAGFFRAYDQNTGEPVWEVNLGAQVSGYPATFEVEGRQYVAVSTGPSLAGGSALRLAPEFQPSTDSNLFVFALPNT